MKKITIYSFLLAAFISFGSAVALAQNHNKNSKKNNKEYYKKQEKANKAHYKYVQKKHANDRHYSYSKMKRRNGPPSWAPAHGYRAKNHVYFRDYNTFYDPYRDGYLYRRKNKWIFSRNVPTFLVGVNLGSARMHLITDIPIERHPEQYYSRYVDLYPRDPRVQINLSLF